MPSNAPTQDHQSHGEAPASSDSWVIGVDIGGTKVAAGLVNRRTGAINHPTRVPMSARGSAAEGFAAVTNAIDSLPAEVAPDAHGAQGIGICAPGPLDPNTGIVLNPPNLPCWRNFPLAAELERAYRLPVKVDNDANAAALAETLWGAGRGYRNVFYATIGTGIGTGIVFDGQIYHGRTGSAAEGGHMTIDYDGLPCACGKRGCIEALAAGPAIARLARTRLSAQPAAKSLLLKLAAGNPDGVTSELVGQAYSAGDAIAEQVLDDVVGFLSVWLGNIIDLLEPDVILMGGGVSAVLKPLFPEITKRLPTCCVNQRCQEIPLLPACYGTDVGIAGGAALCVPAPPQS
jgi:glucokinase